MYQGKSDLLAHDLIQMKSMMISLVRLKFILLSADFFFFRSFSRAITNDGGALRGDKDGNS